MSSPTCTVCGRPLHSAASQARGMGMVCAAKTNGGTIALASWRDWTGQIRQEEDLTPEELIARSEADQARWHEIEEQLKLLVADRAEQDEAGNTKASVSLTEIIWAAIEAQEELHWPLDEDRLSRCRHRQMRRERLAEMKAARELDVDLFAV